ncbi:MAG TPA: ATP synthase F1 subunit epsilon, partial [Tepidiformaceae bacterium]|nr:ATP synthase F1 subunit epsilon [Tepidiformaceae bacterium]
MPLTVEIVTAERIVRTEKGVDVLVAPGTEGQLAILPKHAALMTTLQPGELLFRRGTEEEPFAVTGGFMEVRNDRVTILADAAEPAHDVAPTVRLLLAPLRRTPTVPVLVAFVRPAHHLGHVHAEHLH